MYILRHVFTKKSMPQYENTHNYKQIRVCVRARVRVFLYVRVHIYLYM